IENCKIVYHCPKTWNALIETDDYRVRYCPECDRGVHLCASREELQQANEKDWCVAVMISEPDEMIRRRQERHIKPEHMLVGYIRPPDYDAQNQQANASETDPAKICVAASISSQEAMWTQCWRCCRSPARRAMPPTFRPLPRSPSSGTPKA